MEMATLILSLSFVALNAFFVAAEFALVKIRSTRLEVLANKGHPLALLAQSMVGQLDAYLSATQLGITLASLGLGWVGEPAFAKLLVPLLSRLHIVISEPTIHSISFTLAFLIISGLHIILGELVPKSIAIQSAEKICLFVALPLRAFYVIFYPFLWLLNGTANAFLRLIHFPPASGGGRPHSEEELKLIFEDSYEQGAIGPRKKILLQRAVDFSHQTIGAIKIPKDKVDYFYLDKSLHENLISAKEAAHTRFPVAATMGSKVLGFVHMKDVIWGLENQEVIHLYDLLRPILYFDETKRIDEALIEFQVKKIHMAIVQRGDEEIGLVTLEDVIEELVGDIEDEFDQTK